MTGLAAMRKAAVAAIEARKIFARVNTHSGPVSVETLKLYNQKMPACLIACLRVKGLAAIPTGVAAIADWGAWILTEDKQAAKRDELMLDEVTALMTLCCQQRWGEGGALTAESTPDLLSASNLTTPMMEREYGVNLWLVSWRQLVKLPPDEAASYVALTEIATSYDLAPADGTAEARDQVKLSQE
jgi:hypothetical protein